MKYFSIKHKAHFLLDVEYDIPLSMILHVVENLTSLSFSVQTYWLSVVAFLPWLFLKLLVWPLYLVMNEFKGRC